MRPRAKHRANPATAESDSNVALAGSQSWGWLPWVAVTVAVLLLAAAIWFRPPGFLSNPGLLSDSSLAPSGSGAPPAGDSPASARPASSPPQNDRQRPRGPTIQLATAGLPLSAEDLQQETEEIGRQLLVRFERLPEAMHVAALMHAQLRQTAQAEKLWAECVAAAPHDDRYRINLAAVAMDRGNYELAAQTLGPAAAKADASPEVSHHLGLALSNLGRGEEAETLLMAALKTYPQSAAHWLVLGQTQLKLAKPAEAETSLHKAQELGIDSADLYFALGNAYAQQGKPEEAARARAEFARRKESQPLAADERFAVLSLQEARNTAVTVMIEAATVHAWQEDSLEAERLLLRAIAIQPGSTAGCRKLAQIYGEAGLLAEQRVVLQRLLQLEPLNLLHYIELARVAAELDDPEGAEATLKLAISVSPASAAPYETLARFYVHEQQPKKARWYAQEAVRREPTAEGFVLLASACRLLGDETTAEEALAEARRLEAGQPGAAPAARNDQ